MMSLTTDGHLVEAIIGLTVAECLALVVYRRWTGRGLAPADCVAYLLSGTFLLIALREALIGASWTMIAGALLGSLVAHLVDLRHRLARSSETPASRKPERS